MTKTFKVSISGFTYGYSNEQYVNAIVTGLNQFFTKNADIAFKYVTSAANVYVKSKEIYLGNRTHARGLQKGNVLYLHSGYIGAGHGTAMPQAYWWRAFDNTAGISQVLAHEFWHYIMGPSHSNNTSCLSHLWAVATDLCEAEKIKLQKKYGKPLPTVFAAEDVNKDGVVTSADVLQIINNLNSKGPHKAEANEKHLDVNKDGFVTSADVLQVVNCVNKTT